MENYSQCYRSGCIGASKTVHDRSNWRSSRSKVHKAAQRRTLAGVYRRSSLIILNDTA